MATEARAFHCKGAKYLLGPDGAQAAVVAGIGASVRHDTKKHRAYQRCDADPKPAVETQRNNLQAMEQTHAE